MQGLRRRAEIGILCKHELAAEMLADPKATLEIVRIVIRDIDDHRLDIVRPRLRDKIDVAHKREERRKGAAGDIHDLRLVRTHRQRIEQPHLPFGLAEIDQLRFREILREFRLLRVGIEQ